MKNTVKLERAITNDISILKEILANYSTYSISGWCLSYNLVRANSDEEEKLHSPAKQLSFLLGVMLSTKEPQSPAEIDQQKWLTILQKLNELFNHYWLLYLPEEDSKDKPSDYWYKTREISMIAFFNYFDSGLLASIEQVKERIKNNLLPFDTYIESISGISLRKSLEICDFIVGNLQKEIDRLSELQDLEYKLRLGLIEKHMGDTWSIEQMRKEAQDGQYLNTVNEYFAVIKRIGQIRIGEIIDEFTESGRLFCERFIIKRGDGPDIRYPTDTSVFDTRPLILWNNDTVICPSTNALYLAIASIGEKAILDSEQKAKYLRERDKELENSAKLQFSRLVNKNAIILSSVCETATGQFEHDVIIDDELLTLIIEAKASPPVEPLRDPDRAFIRIRDAFKSHTGIQKAYDQASSILEKMTDNGYVDLYNANGKLVYRLIHNPDKIQLAVCVTRDNFGALATNLSLLLDKKAEATYPWVVNILDLQNFTDGWTYLKYNEEKFCHFLEQRILLHGKVHSDDELEYAGFFIQHGGFDSILSAKADLIQLNPHYSDIFDSIYKAQYYDGSPVNIDVVAPVMMDLKESLRRDKPVFINDREIVERKSKKTGRNELCPCGSGKKYKKCCGR